MILYLEFYDLCEKYTIFRCNYTILKNVDFIIVCFKIVYSGRSFPLNCKIVTFPRNDRIPYAFVNFYFSFRACCMIEIIIISRIYFLSLLSSCNDLNLVLTLTYTLDISSVLMIQIYAWGNIILIRRRGPPLLNC